MGNCKNCRYWDKDDCECNFAVWLNKSTIPIENGFSFYADAHDDSGLDAGVRTGPEFGCIQFREKGKKNG